MDDAGVEGLILQIGKKAIELVPTCSNNNIKELEAENNHKVADKLEALLEQIKNTEIQNYFVKGNVPSDSFIAVLYCLNVLATYHLYNKHDGAKAREILMNSKVLAEQYLKKQAQLPDTFEFDKLTNEEKLKELRKISDLPEVYTIMIYILGRTFLYKGVKKDALPYLELSKYLGCELNLFEGFLSEGRGIGLIKREMLANQIEGGLISKAEACEEIKGLIEVFQRLQTDPKEYREGFKPLLKTHNIVVPGTDSYNWMDCSEHLIRCYVVLICLTEDHQEQTKLFHDVMKQFVGSDESKGALQELNTVPPRKAATILHSLGKTLVVAYDRGIDFQKYQSVIGKVLQEEDKLSKLDDLNFIEEIFQLVEQKSKPNDFTLADAYDGLKKVYKRLILKKHEDDKRYENAKIKRNEVNKNLNRIVTLKYGYA